MNIISTTIDFKNQAHQSNWYIVNDGVMGGLSNGKLRSSDEGISFYGDLSLENNGGFSWAQYSFSKPLVLKEKTVKIRIKTDDRGYSFTLKTKGKYRTHFESRAINTKGEWKTITIQLTNMKETWRGRQWDGGVDLGDTIVELGVIIKDKKEGSFSMLLDSVEI